MFGKYIRKLWRIRKDKYGDYIIQSSYIGLFWFTAIERYRGLEHCTAEPYSFAELDEAEEMLNKLAKSHEYRYHKRVENKKQRKEDKKFKKNYGRQP